MPIFRACKNAKNALQHPIIFGVLASPWTTLKTEKRKFACSWEMKSVPGHLKRTPRESMSLVSHWKPLTGAIKRGCENRPCAEGSFWVSRSPSEQMSKQGSHSSKDYWDALSRGRVWRCYQGMAGVSESLLLKTQFLQDLMPLKKLTGVINWERERERERERESLWSVPSTRTHTHADLSFFYIFLLLLFSRRRQPQRPEPARVRYMCTCARFAIFTVSALSPLTIYHAWWAVLD